MTLKQLDTQWQMDRKGQAASIVQAMLTMPTEYTMRELFERLGHTIECIKALGVNVG